jgi:hypothetical protein
MLYARPARRSQNNDCNASRTKVLLIPEALIGRNENIKRFSFRCVEHALFFSVAQPRSYAVETSCCLNDSRKGTGTPWSNSTRT